MGAFRFEAARGFRAVWWRLTVRTAPSGAARRLSPAGEV